MCTPTPPAAIVLMSERPRPIGHTRIGRTLVPAAVAAVRFQIPCRQSIPIISALHTFPPISATAWTASFIRASERPDLRPQLDGSPLFKGESRVDRSCSGSRSLRNFGVRRASVGLDALRAPEGIGWTRDGDTHSPGYSWRSDQCGPGWTQRRCVVRNAYRCLVSGGPDNIPVEC